MDGRERYVRAGTGHRRIEAAHVQKSDFLNSKVEVFGMLTKVDHSDGIAQLALIGENESLGIAQLQLHMKVGSEMHKKIQSLKGNRLKGKDLETIIIKGICKKGRKANFIDAESISIVE